MKIQTTHPWIQLTILLLFLIGCNWATPPRMVETPAATMVDTVAPATGVVETPTPTTMIESPTSTQLPTQPTQTPASAPGAPGLGDSLYPGFGNGGYDVWHYTLDLTINSIDTGDLLGVATIAAQATQNLSCFNLDFIGFSIESITIDGQAASFERRDAELTITPAKPLEAGQSFVAQISYSGAPKAIQSIATEGQVGWILFDGGSYVLSEPDGAATYYPTNDHPLDKATYTFYVTVPKPFVVVANGVLASTLDQGETTTFAWEAPDPMASYLTTVNIGEFELETASSPGGTTIRNYYSAGLDESVRLPFSRQGEMLALYSETFGPYPFAVYGSLIVDTEMGTALESQTLSLYGVDQLDLEDIPLAEQLVAHELAHQWFGDSLSVADWRDIWLNEGFAIYAEGLWIEDTEGSEALDEWIIGLYEYTAEAGDEMVPPGAPEAGDLFNEGVYCRGGLTLHALRLEVGDDIFFDILREYVDRFENSNVRTSDFIAVAEEVSGQELDTFFENWLYNEDMPPIPTLGLTVK